MSSKCLSGVKCNPAFLSPSHSHFPPMAETHRPHRPPHHPCSHPPAPLPLCPHLSLEIGKLSLGVCVSCGPLANLSKRPSINKSKDALFNTGLDVLLLLSVCSILSTDKLCLQLFTCKYLTAYIMSLSHRSTVTTSYDFWLLKARKTKTFVSINMIRCLMLGMLTSSLVTF